MQTVLLADDEGSLRQALALIIERAGYRCVEARNGAEALELIGRERPDLVVLDVMMPELDGFEVIERIRATDQRLPILMLSAKADIVDKRTGFRLGADDYMAKPFNEEEFVLHIGALLRRGAAERLAGAPTSSAPAGGADGRRELRAAGLYVDLLHRRVELEGEPVALTPREFDILAVLASEPGRAFTSTELVELIWGPDFTHDAISIPVYIRRLRKKLEADPADPSYIQTVRQVGYRLVAP